VKGSVLGVEDLGFRAEFLGLRVDGLGVVVGVVQERVPRVYRLGLGFRV